jgi:hypothetical protein
MTVICAWCKKLIRTTISNENKNKKSHGICTCCLNKLIKGVRR